MLPPTNAMPELDLNNGNTLSLSTFLIAVEVFEGATEFFGHLISSQGNTSYLPTIKPYEKSEKSAKKFSHCSAPGNHIFQNFNYLSWRNCPGHRLSVHLFERMDEIFIVQSDVRLT